MSREAAQIPSAEGAESNNSTTAADGPSVREIHKNSWLKRLSDKNKFPKTQKQEKVWVVFCVHEDKNAFLEFYENRRSAYSHVPLSTLDLSDCLHVSPTLLPHGPEDHEFVITLSSQVIRLAASSQEQMMEWMNIMTGKLRDLGVLEPKDNPYSKDPIPSHSLLQPAVSVNSLDSQSREDFSRMSLRDPTSPLPPVPAPSLSDGVVFVRNPSTPAQQDASTPPVGSSLTTDASSVTNIFQFDEPPASIVERLNNDSNSSSQLPSPAADQSTVPSSHSECIYEPLFCVASHSIGSSVRNPGYENPPHRHTVFKPTPAPPITRSDLPWTSASVANDIHFVAAPRPSNLCHLTSSSDPTLDALSRQQSSGASLRSRSHNEGNSTNERSGLRIHSNSAFVDSTLLDNQEGNRRPLMSLRESQVLQLQTEIQHRSGVRLMLRKKDCLYSIAFVDCFNAVWVAGWKQRERPLLHNTFHLGDQLLSIASQPVHSSDEAQQAIQRNSSHTIEFVVKRVPHGKVIGIRREYEAQDLGIILEGGTPEIRDVRIGSLAARHGLPTKAVSQDGRTPCTWFLTEINHRPLSPFFKDNEVIDRLNAVGLDISFLAQPSDLVKALRKQLKAIRNRKDYIVQ